MTVSVYAKDGPAAGRPDIVRKVLQYPFDQVGVRHLRAEIVAGNERSVRQAEKMGFRLRGTLPGAAQDGGDLLIYGMKPEESPFLQRKRSLSVG